MSTIHPTQAPAGQLTYTNPVYDGPFADPFVFRVGSTYYAVGTGDDESDWSPAKLSTARERAHVIPILRSDDLVHWKYLGRALIPHPDDCAGPFWAPEVAAENGKYYLYYSVGLCGHEGHAIRVAVSDAPAGPYRDNHTTLIDRATTPFSIDAHPFRDADGQWYLFYAKDFLDTDNGNRAGTALVVDRLIDMTRLAGEERVVMRARCNWQLYEANRTMYGQIFDWHTLEGPFVLRRNNKYYCFYSGGCFQNESYGVDYATADHPLGPWDGQGSESGPRVLKTLPGQVIGPGHCSIVTGPDNKTDYLVYHAWPPDMSARRMRIDPLVWTKDGPRCQGPTTPQPTPTSR